jgi:hypothetical protein
MQGATFRISVMMPMLPQSLKRLDQVRAATVANIEQATRAAALEMHAEISKVPPMHRISGTLARSWSDRTTAFGDLSVGERKVGFIAKVGSNLVYAPIEEYGYNGPIRAHTRRVKSRDVRRLIGFGLRMMGKRGLQPMPKYERVAQGVCFVKAHTMHRDAHPYATPGMKRALPAIRGYFKQAVAAGSKGDRVSFGAGA